MDYPIVLSFNSHDPTGGAGITADTLTCASLEVAAFTVPTALLTGDFSALDMICTLDADWVDDQARTLLEDSVIQAIKIGVIPSVQMVQVIAEIISDYPDVPVILAPSVVVGDEDQRSEDIILAMHELLIPNSHILIVQRHLLMQLAEVKHDFTQVEANQPQLLSTAHAQALQHMGVDFLLAMDARAPDSQVVHKLFHQQELIQTMATPRLKDSFLGANSTLSAAVAALIAQGHPTEHAVTEALEFTWQTLRYGISMGMGKKIPDRFYWVRQNIEEENPAEESVAVRPSPSTNTLQ